MGDYGKLNIRFANKGLNIARSASALEFGEWATFKNVYSNIEGEVTARRGFSLMSSAATGSAILGIRRLNNSVASKSAYLIKAANGKYYITVDGSSHLSTTTPFTFYDIGAAAPSTIGSSVFGSFVIERPNLSASAFAYAGDRSGMFKFSSDSAGGLIIKNMGIVRPIGPPVLIATAGGSLTASSTYYYRYTLYDKNTGAESLFNSSPNPLTPTSISTTGVNKTVHNVIPTETVDAAVTHVRVYRKGGTLSAWQRVSDDSATYTYTGTTINFDDALSDSAIAASTLLDDLSDKPFSTTQTTGTVVSGQPLPYLFGPYLGYVLACGDGNNPGFVYWTNKFNPDSQDPSNNVEVSSPQDPLQNGVIYDGKPFVFSKEALYTLYTGVSESTFTPSLTACGHGLWAPHALCVGPQIYFLGNDGIYSTAGGIEQAITDNELRPLFDPDNPAQTVSPYTVNGIGVVDYTATTYMFMEYHKNEVWFQYLGKDSNTWVLIYDTRYHRWRTLFGGMGGQNVRCIYEDEQTTSNLLLGGNDGNLYQDGGFNDGTVAINSEVKTGLITLGAPLIHKEFGFLVFDVDPAGATVTFKIYKDRGATLIDPSSLGYTGQTSSATRTRLFINLADTFSEDLQIDVTWSSSTVAPILYGYELFYRSDVPQMNRWSLTGTTHGILGWQILRSGYFTLRSDGTVILAITYDTNTGSVYSYTLPTTGGSKVKIFMPFDALKGKSWSYSLALGTATYFRFYPEESEIHVKPWISSFGYQAVNPFIAGSTMQDVTQGSSQVGSGGGEMGGSGGGSSGGGNLASIGPIPSFDFSGLGGGTPIGPITTEGPGSPTISPTEPGGSSESTNTGGPFGGPGFEG